MLQVEHTRKHIFTIQKLVYTSANDGLEASHVTGCSDWSIPMAENVLVNGDSEQCDTELGLLALLDSGDAVLEMKIKSQNYIQYLQKIVETVILSYFLIHFLYKNIYKIIPHITRNQFLTFKKD